MNFKLNFNTLVWETPSQGVKQKTFSVGDKQLRLVRFEDDFAKDDWCTIGHIGYVTDGEMNLDFEGKIINYKKGEAIAISKDVKHKAIIKKNKFVEIIPADWNVLIGV